MVAATPRIARLFASVPPEVNTTSSVSAPTSAATWARARSTAARARRPSTCPLDGLPQQVSRASVITATTSGSTGVVALWSR